MYKDHILTATLKIIFAASILSVMLTGCFTGVENTPRITDKDVRKQVVESKPEDSYLEEIKQQNISSDFKEGKPWVIVDSKFKLLLNPEIQDINIKKGDTIRFKKFEEAVTVTGDRVAEIHLATSNGETIAYRTSIDFNKIQTGYPVTIPFTVDLDLVDKVRNKMLGQKYYIETRTRYDMNDQIYYGRRFVPVTICSVDYGNEYYPIRLTATEQNGQSFRLYMSIGPESRMPRKFSALFSISDPRLNYPDILPETWQKIVEGKVAAGMTRDECRLSLGSPDNVDRQAGYSSVREIWTYNNGCYLLFLDGILETFRQ